VHPALRTMTRLRSSCWCRRASLTALTLVLVSCGSDVVGPNLGPLLFDITIGCFPSPDPPYTCTAPTTTFAHGDTITIGELLIDTTSSHHEAHVVVRAICWQNLEIRRGGQVVDYLPRVSTCPDSTMLQGDNSPSVFNLRFFRFLVPDVWSPGAYSVRSLMLVDPPATVTRTFTIR
jgi:hypothetical protein